MEQPKEITSKIVSITNTAKRTCSIANAFKINSNEDYELAGVQLKKIKDTSRSLQEERLGITRPMDEAKKKIMAHFKGPIDLLAEAERTIKRGMVTYQNKLEEERRVEQKRLDDLAEEQRLRDEAEKKLKEEEEKKANEQKKEENESNYDERPQVDMTAPIELPPAPVEVVKYVAPDNRPKVKGVSVKKIWYAEITDKKEILAAVLSGKIPENAIDINMKFFNSQAKSLKEGFSYPGVVAKTKKSIGA